MKSEFPLDFTNWFSLININTGEIKHSKVKIPIGYEIFKNDITATQLLGAFDSNRESFYLGFPYSDSILRLEGTAVLQTFHLPSTLSYKYIPTEATLLKGGETAYILPKEGSKHIFMIYDPYRDLFLRTSKIKESGIGATNFTRTKHYVLALFTPDFEPLGEYLFDFEGSLDLENWFIAEKGLFLNKPEQKSEDFYEFWHIDLSTFNQSSDQ